MNDPADVATLARGFNNNPSVRDDSDVREMGRLVVHAERGEKDQNGALVEIGDG